MAAVPSPHDIGDGLRHNEPAMGERYDCIVIGLGAMGSMALWQLALRGARVLGIEACPSVPHDRGSYHGDTRAIRLAYFEHPDYVPLLRRSYLLWRELEREADRQLLHVCGGVYVGPPECELVAGSLEAARRHGLPHELLDRDALGQRFPPLRLPDGFVGFVEPDAGYIMSEASVASAVTCAHRRGATVRTNETVLRWSSAGDSAIVETVRARYEARRLIVTAGPWSGRLLRDLGADLTVTRQVQLWVQPRDNAAFAYGAWPIWAIDRPAGGMYYGFPVQPPDDPSRSIRPGFKLAVHHPGPATDPETIDRAARQEELDELHDMLHTYLPDADGPVLSTAVCMYTCSPDQHFIIDRHPGHNPVIVACGFSGHGFKFASVVGEALADLALGGMTNLPIGFLGLHRFGHAQRPDGRT